DYAGDLPYIDYDVTDNGNGTATVSDTRRYLADGGIASQYGFATQQSTYLHGDMLRSTVLTTNSAGLADDTFAYTAFGEAITPDGLGGWLVGFPPTDPVTRYLYAGGWGYESGSDSEPGLLWVQGADASLPPITLQHVGHRWYEPSTGRFVQRDPIGIAGGLNVYAYCGANPVHLADPSGLAADDDDWVTNVDIIAATAAGGAGGAAAVGGLAGPVGAGTGAIAGGVGAGAGAAGYLFLKYACVSLHETINLYREKWRNEREFEDILRRGPQSKPPPPKPRTTIRVIEVGTGVIVITELGPMLVK
ncbi:MAG: RHS repeat-associated core domain-containing protein, partial [Planctomycetes bacterium]|nr:RHS repeat-associated core domain-containing protein [Planctomycetota bacterium]